MTYDDKDIDDLALFASEHDDDDWLGAEPTRPQRPRSLRPPTMLPPPQPRLTYGVGLAIAFTAAVAAVAVFLCLG